MHYFREKGKVKSWYWPDKMDGTSSEMRRWEAVILQIKGEWLVGSWMLELGRIVRIGVEDEPSSHQRRWGERHGSHQEYPALEVREHWALPSSWQCHPWRHVCVCQEWLRRVWWWPGWVSLTGWDCWECWGCWPWGAPARGREWWGQGWGSGSVTLPVPHGGSSHGWWSKYFCTKLN